MCGSLLQSPRLDLQPGKGEQNKSGPKMRGELRWSSLYSQPRLERHPLRRKMVKEAGITHARQAGTLATACSFVRAHGVLFARASACTPHEYSMPEETRRGHQIPGIGVTDGCQLPCRC
ncbi:hypothetical protein LEMLEM_LOCUS20356, partial [Lemmus lemmus]